MARNILALLEFVRKNKHSNPYARPQGPNTPAGATTTTREHIMTRKVLDNNQIHPAIQSAISDNQFEIMNEVTEAVANNDIVVIGMGGNPHVGTARKVLKAAGHPVTYLQYGGYLSQWRKRNALKMWTGWATFPMVFVKGNLIGGATEARTLIDNGELQKMLDSSEPSPLTQAS